MNKTTKIALVAIVIVLLVVAIVVGVKLSKKDGNKEETKLGTITSAEGLENLVNKIYEGVNKDDFPMVETTAIDVTENDMVKMLTGLDNGNDLEYLVVSQPLMSSQAYSLVLAKVKSGVKANDIAKTMSEQVDTRRWICVEAEKLYANNSGDIVCLVMADSEKAEAVYKSFKELAGTVGQEYEKTAEEEELPPDMY